MAYDMTLVKPYKALCILHITTIIFSSHGFLASTHNYDEIVERIGSDNVKITVARDLQWIYVDSRHFAASHKKTTMPQQLLTEKDNLKQAKENLIKQYKIHIMPEPEYIHEVIVRILLQAIKEPSFGQCISSIKFQNLLFTQIAVDDQELIPFIVVYINENNGKLSAQIVAKTLASILDTIPQVEQESIDPQKFDQLKDKRLLCPRFNLPFIPHKHLICYAQGEGYYKKLRGFLLSTDPLEIKDLYKKLPLREYGIEFFDIDNPCKNTIIPRIAGYSGCAEIKPSIYGTMQKALREKDKPTNKIDENPQLLVAFFNGDPPLSAIFFAHHVIQQDAGNLLNGEEIKALLEAAINLAKSDPEIASKKFGDAVTNILRSYNVVTGPTSFAEMIFEKADNFALYPADFTGTILDHHLYP